MRLTSIQKAKVDEIVQYYDPSRRGVIVEFKAPTGSGKTFMAAHVISEIINQNLDDKLIFVIATLSSSELPLAFKEKLDYYKPDLAFSSFEVEYIESPSSSGNTEVVPRLFPEKNKVYIFGKATFGKGRIFSEMEIIDDFIYMAIDRGFKIVYIRDEAHVGLGSGDNRDVVTRATRRKFEDLMKENSFFTLHMTATPNMRADTKKVILYESELNDPSKNDDRWLLKTQLEPLLDRNIEDTKLLEHAISKFKNIQEEYRQLGEEIGIRPALLIQVDNKPSNGIQEQEFLEEIENIKTTLIEHGLCWVKYFGNNDKESHHRVGSNFNLNDLTRKDSDIDVIIFKIGPATGWDIPRACMLLQLRNVSSTALNTQTIGRIKRNPYPNLERNEITDKYYVYSNAELERQTKVFKYKVKKDYQSDDFVLIKIANYKELDKDFENVDISKEVLELLNSDRDSIVQKVKQYFKKNDSGQQVYRTERLRQNENAIYNDIENVFKFLRYYEGLKVNNEKLYRKIEKSVEKFLNENKISLFENDNVYLQKEHLITVLLKDYKTKLLNLISKKQTIDLKYEFALEQYKPLIYTEIYSDIINMQSTDESPKYLFDISEDNNATYNQPLDSKAEKFVFEKLRGFINRNQDRVKIWAKNQTTSNISSEYLDENKQKRKSYFDYILKFENNYFLYIEVKSINDIDPEKTAKLKKAYESYFENKKETLFNPEIVLSIWTVDTENGGINHESYYNKDTIESNLNQLTIDELLGYLSGL